MRVLTKKDLDMLGTLPFQRNCSIRNELVKSMQQYGFLGCVLMIKTSKIHNIEKLYCIDGAHRVLCAQFLNIDITADIIDVNHLSTREIVDLVSKLNSTGVKWSITDYINAYAGVGMLDYIRLADIIRDCKKIVQSNVYKMLTENYMIMNKATNIIKNGNLTVSHDIILNIHDTNNLLKKLPKMNRDMILALHQVKNNSNFNFDTFKIKIAENMHMLQQKSVAEYKQIFLNFFN